MDEQQSYAPIGVSPDGFLLRKWGRTEEPYEGNLHVRVCGGERRVTGASTRKENRITIPFPQRDVHIIPSQEME
jgi:hypothetical protein